MKAPTILAGLIVLLMPAIALANMTGGGTFGLGTAVTEPPAPQPASGPTFGLGDPNAPTAAPVQVRYVSGPVYGLGDVVVLATQDCPSGVCPNVRPTARIVTRQVKRQPVLAPRTQVTRTVTEVQRPQVVSSCPTGTCPTAYQAAPVTVAAAFPTCPGEVWTPVGPPRVVSVTYGDPIVTSVGNTCPPPMTVAVNACPTCPDWQPTRTVTRQVTRRPIIQRRGEWTWPGDLDSHLAGPPHYVPWDQLAQMSHGEKVALHDAQHNSGVGGRGLVRGRLFSRLRARFRR